MKEINSIIQTDKDVYEDMPEAVDSGSDCDLWETVQRKIGNKKRAYKKLLALVSDELPIESLEEPRKSRRGWTRYEAAIDSKAADNVSPPGAFDHVELKPSRLSMAGKGYVSATKHRTANLGERGVRFETNEGVDKNIRFQVADIGKVLVSANKLNEAGYEVQLSKKNPHIRRAKDGEVTSCGEEVDSS